MAKDDNVKLDHKGIDELLHTAEMKNLVQFRAKMIAGAAGAGHQVYTDPSGDRVRATVKTVTAEAKRAEAESRNLTRAINAGML